MFNERNLLIFVITQLSGFAQNEPSTCETLISAEFCKITLVGKQKTRSKEAESIQTKRGNEEAAEKPLFQDHLQSDDVQEAREDLFVQFDQTEVALCWDLY